MKTPTTPTATIRRSLSFILQLIFWKTTLIVLVAITEKIWCLKHRFHHS